MTMPALMLALFLEGGAAGAGSAAPDSGAGGAAAAAPPGNAEESGVPEDGAQAPHELAPATSPAPAAPATRQLVGRVIAMGGGQAPVAGAALSADLTTLGTTDEQGAFALELPCGPHHLVVQAPGFEPVNEAVDACAPDPKPLVLRLIPAPDAQAFETVVRTKTTQPVIHMEGKELTQTPGTLGDPLRVLESLPGVTTASWPSPVYAVRGSNPGNTGFFLDGVRLPALFHMALGPSVIHPYFLGGMEFYPGGYPARYGRYAAGVVLAETRPGDESAMHASVDARLFDAGAMVSAPIAGGTVAVAARYSYTGELITLLSEDLKLNYWDYQLRADRRVGPVQLTLLVFGSGDEFSPTKSQDIKDLRLGFHRVSLRAAVPVLGGRLQGSVALGTDHSRAPVADTFPITVASRSVAPRLSFTRSFSHASFALGFDGEIARYDPVYLGPLRPDADWDLATRRTATLLAGYASATIRPVTRVTITPELRYDTYQVSGAFARDLAPRLAFQIDVRDDTSIRAAGGHFTQLPSLPLQLPGADAFGLKLLGLQTSWQGSLGVETAAVAGATLSLTGYLQHYELTELRNPGLFTLETVGSDLLARREAIAYGLEMMARRMPAKGLYGWVSYTLSTSQRSYGGGAVGPSDWDQRHVLNLVSGYRSGRNTLGARFHLNTGRPIVLNDSVPRLPVFYQLDLRADHVFYFDRFTLNVYAEVVNATATNDVYGYNQPSQGPIQQQSFRIVLPSIGIRGEI